MPESLIYSLFFADWGLELYLKRDSGTGVPVNFEKILIRPFFIELLRWRLLKTATENNESICSSFY